jgi:hypothetical protein
MYILECPAHCAVSPDRYALFVIGLYDSKGVNNEWEFKEELEPLLPCQCLSVGFLIERTKEYTAIIQSVSANQILGRLTIPNCSTTYMKKLK